MKFKIAVSVKVTITFIIILIMAVIMVMAEMLYSNIILVTVTILFTDSKLIRRYQSSVARIIRKKTVQI